MSYRNIFLSLIGATSFVAPAFANLDWEFQPENGFSRGIETIPTGGKNFLVRLQCDSVTAYSIRLFSTEKSEQYLVEVNGIPYLGKVAGVDNSTEFQALAIAIDATTVSIPVTLVLGLSWNPESHEVQEARLINKWNGQEFSCNQITVR